MRLAHPSSLTVAALFLAACNGGGGGQNAPPIAQPLGSLTDADAAVDTVNESARPGARVGITVSAPELAARGGVTFSLSNNSNGAFAIDAMSGLISLAGSVDYEVTTSRTVTARATSADGQYFAERDFMIAVLDSPAPILDIEFPFAHANYAYATIGISGRVTHPDPASIDVHASAGSTSVAGIVSADGTFFVKDVPVPEGTPTTITVTASHAGNDSDTKSITLSRAPDLTDVEAMIVDEARDRYVLADRYSGTIVAIARDGYARSIVSGAGRGLGTRLDEPVDLALDPVGDRLYVLDNALDAVIRVDPRSGDRTVVSGGAALGSAVGSGPFLIDPKALVYDASRHTLFVADDGLDSLVAIDPASGARTIVSDNSAPFGPTLYFWNRLGLDAPRNRLIAVSISISEQYGIDLTTGVRSLVSDASHDFPDANRSFTAISVAATRGAAYLADDFSNAVVRMDLATGARTSITSSGLSAGLLTHPVIGTGPELEWPSAVLYDESQNRLFVVDQGFAAPLIEVDEATGNRTLLTNSAVGLGINFKGPWGIVLDPANHTAFVTDIVADIVVAVNLDDGSRQLIAGSPTGRGTIATDPIAVDVDAAEAQLYIVDFTENSLYSLDLATGARRTISDATTGSGPVLENPIDVAVDPTAGVVYVLDALLDALLSVDRASGDRRIVASGFGGPAGCAVDRDNGVAYVSTGFGDVIRVDLSSGQQTVVSSNLVGAGPRLGQIGDLALDAKHGRLIALDRYPNRVFSIDIATGDRRIASGPGTNGSEAGGGPSLELPRAVEVDPSRGIAYVTDDLYNAVIAVDLASGYRQVVAR